VSYKETEDGRKVVEPRRTVAEFLLLDVERSELRRTAPLSLSLSLSLARARARALPRGKRKSERRKRGAAYVQNLQQVTRMDTSSSESDWAAPRTSLAGWPRDPRDRSLSRAALLPWESIAGDLFVLGLRRRARDSPSAERGIRHPHLLPLSEAEIRKDQTGIAEF